MAVYGSCGQEELYHYGVLGMKWGIRHNPVKAYEKSSAKAKKNREKYDKAKNAERSLSYTISQRRMSAFKGRRNTSKLEKKLEGRSAKTIRRAQKGAKWYKSMESNFAKVDMKLAKKQKDEFEMYLKELDAFNDRLAEARERRRG
jgi:hypothetical protein|nr:MAG TPA: hypothetical protein [Caudoviricetes sp.]